MTPRDAVESRLDRFERLQEKNHSENQASLGKLFDKLNPLSERVATLVGDGRHPGRVGECEEKLKKHEQEFENRIAWERAVDRKLAKWGTLITIASALAAFAANALVAHIQLKP